MSLSRSYVIRIKKRCDSREKDIRKRWGSRFDKEMIRYVIAKAKLLVITYLMQSEGT